RTAGRFDSGRSERTVTSGALGIARSSADDGEDSRMDGPTHASHQAVAATWDCSCEADGTARSVMRPTNHPFKTTHPLPSPVKLALVPLNPTVGALADNAAMMAREIRTARDAGCDLVVFPELALCGYPPRDLLLQQGFLQACCDRAKELGEQHTRG